MNPQQSFQIQNITLIGMTALIFYMVFPFLIVNSCFNNDDLKIVSSMIKHLTIKQFIIVPISCDSLGLLSSQLKVLSGSNYLGMSYSFSGLMAYLKSKSFRDVKTMIVIKVDNDLELRKVMKEIKIKVADRKVFLKFTWMMIIPESTTRFTSENFYVPFNCKFFLVHKLVITEIYQVKKKFEMRYAYFGNWSEEKGLNANEQPLFVRRNNLYGDKMIMMRNNQVRCRFLPECLHLDIWENIGEIINYTTTYVKMEELDRKDNQLTGDSSTNISVLTALADDNDEIIGPMLKQVGHIYIKEVDEDEEEWDSYIKPFNENLWNVVLAWTFVSSSTILAIARFASTTLGLKGFTLLDHALMPLTSLCNQAGLYLPNILSSRIARISAYTVSAVLFPAYSASLISSLTVHKPKIPFTDLESFVEDGSYKMTSLRTPYMTTFFQSDHDPILKIIRKKYLLPFDKFPRSHSDAIEVICTKNDIALINFNYRMVQMKAPCSILLVSDEIFDLMGGMKLFNETLSFKQLLQIKILFFHTSGIMQRMQKISFGKTKYDVITEFNPINILETKSIMVFLVLSFLIAILLLTGECFYHCKRRKSSWKTRKKHNIVIIKNRQKIYRYWY